MPILTSDKRLDDVGPVRLAEALAEVQRAFEAKGYQVKAEVLAGGGGHLSLTQGGVFRTVLGLTTALNVKLEPRGRDWQIESSVGVFGQQVLPTLLTLFVAWPVVLAQVWGLVRQSQLDDEVVAAVEAALRRHAEAEGAAAGGAGERLFCTACGAPTPAGARFCARCGQAVSDLV